MNRRRLYCVLLVVMLCLHGADSARADETVPAPESAPPAPAGTPTPADGPGDAPLLDIVEDAPPGSGRTTQRLSPVEIVAPRVFSGPGETAAPVTVTALREPAPTFDVPANATSFDASDIRLRRAARSISGALEGATGVLVQKTGPLQHSPFIRGFTGYNNLMMIDGIRFNNSTFRSGPNQYWATIDPYTVQRLELVRGPRSVLYGSDAVGGVVNVIPWQRTSFCRGLHWDGALFTRYASAEDAVFGRAQVEGNYNGVGWAAGIGYKYFGDITSGAGELPGTGDIDEYDADVRFDWRINRAWTLTVAYQYVRQIDAPRTERTVDAVPFAGTAVGTELQRDFDQFRELAYAKLSFDNGACCKPFSRGHFGVSYHRHEEERDRLRTGDRRDLSGFDVVQIGIHAQLESPTALGRFTYGVDYYHDEVDSFFRGFTGGVASTPRIQGSIGDDATYDLLGAYVQDHIEHGPWEWFLGARFTYAAAQADRVDNPAVAGSDPTTPGNVIQVDNDWTRLVGSAHVVYHLNQRWNVYGGVGQAFRAPTLSDLTALDSTSAIESPAPNLDAEDYISFEAGVRTQQKRVSASAALWYTILDDTIIQSPTGVLINGTPEVRKDNIGDGFMWGVEVEAAWQFHCDWTAFANASWMDGEVDQLDTNGVLQRAPVTRLKPLTWLLGLRFEPRWCPKLWAQAEWRHSEDADKLAFRDETDLRRIPPGGTPGWDVFNLRAGYDFTRKFRASLALENLLDENYRIHGSGQNEPGFNVVVAAEMDF